MRRLLSWILLGIVSVGVPALVACGGEADPHYGPPGGLRNSKFPDPSTTTPATTTTSTTPPPPDGGTPAGDGGPISTACTKKWSTDIYPMLQAAGVWKCATGGCHQNGSKPDIDPNNAATAYNQLVAYKLLTNGQQYIIPNQTDATKHGFDCNLKGTCGAAQMPQGTAATQADIANLEVWLACGAPNN